MKRNIKNHKAFSLIELSIVLLIIGIIVAGIIQASRMVSAFKLNSARSITQSSPVASIKGLLLWLEPTMEASFKDSEEEDETGQITTWNDINPQATTKNNYTRGTSDDKITYEANATNNLPGIELPGTGTTGYLSGTATATEGNALTVFVVAKSNDNTSSNWRDLFSYGGLGYQKRDTRNRNVSFFDITDCSDTTIWSLNSEIASLVYYGTTSSNTIKIYVNGAAKTVSPSTSAVTFGAVSTVSSGFPWHGTISEIIVFDRPLKISERQDVEAYLSKKYGIAVVQNN